MPAVVRCGRLSFMKYLLLAGLAIAVVAVIATVIQLRNPHALARSGAADRLQARLKEDPTLANAADDDGETPLMHAAKYGQVQAVRVLLAAGARSEVKCRGGGTALMMASAFGYADVTKTLLQAGAPVDAADENGVTALHFAVREGHASVVRLLLQAGAPVAARDAAGRTPAAVAKESGHEDLSKEIDGVP
jgi:uncharacterized protein